MNKFDLLPPEVLVNPAQKIVYETPILGQVMPNAVTAMQAVDIAYGNDPEAFLKSLEASQYSFQSSTGAKIDYSLLPGKGSRMLVMWSPFSDCAPKSTASDIYHYAINDETVSRGQAAPNSWNQTTKSAVVHQLLKAIDLEMPVLTIFSPLPSFPHNAYTHSDYELIRFGNFMPADRITAEAVADAQDRLHGPLSETQIDEFDFHGASLGASTALGAALGATWRDKQVHSVTAQELIIAPKNVVPDLASRFILKDPVGEKSDFEVEPDLRQIAEPLIRQQIDRAGNEPAMIGRMLLGMSKLSRLKGLTRPQYNLTPAVIELLVADHGVSVVVPLAESSGLTHDTSQHLPKAGEEVIIVRATAGERTSHLIDEHVALTALTAVMNIRRAHR
jgi:hypothetical protein